MDQEQYDKIFSDLSTGKLRYRLGSYPQYVVKEGKLYYKLTWRNNSSRKVVTVSEKKKVLEDCHSHGKKHLDTVMDKTLAKVSERYYWPRMEVDVEEFCQSCEQCQATNRSLKTRSTPTREQTRNLSASGGEATTLRSPTPDPPSQKPLEESWGTKFINFASGLNPFKRGGQAGIQPTAPSEFTQPEDFEDLGPKLCALCMTGDEDEVRALLDDPDTDVNVTDSTGETPLHKACCAGKLQIIKLLLQQDDIDINKRNNNGQTPLHIVSKVGNIEAAQLLLDAESDESNAISYVNSLDNRGLTPLCYSAKFSKHIQMVNFLRERGADLGFSLKSAATCTEWETKDAMNLVYLCGGLYQNRDILFEAIRSEGGTRYCSITDEDSNTLLHLALLHGWKRHAKEIIQMSKDVIDAENKQFKTPLHLAIETGNIEIVDILLDCNAKITCAKGSKMTPLHMAVKQTSAEFPIEHVVKALLGRQTAAANVNSRDINMQTPLHYAAEYCSEHPHVTKLLLSSGAKIDVQDKDGLTPLMVAAMKGCESTFDVMVKTEEGIRVVKKALLQLAQGKSQQPIKHQTNEHLDILLTMPETVQYLSCTDSLGNTPLHIAAKHNCVSAVSLLLTKGADCTLPNNVGRTPLHLAAASGCIEAVQVLIDNKKCDVTIQDKWKKTPLHAAVEHENENILKLVVRKVVDCNISDYNGRTPLHLATAMGYTRNVQVLLEKDKNALFSEDKDGLTPLHIACEIGDIHLVETLLNKGADADQKNVQGSTPLNIAIRKSRKETVKLLLSKGASFLSSFISAARKREEATAMIQICGDNAVKKAVFEAVGGVERHESLDFLRLLLDSAGNFCYSTDPQSGNTPLHVAASVGYVEAVNLLLQKERRYQQKRCVEKENKEKRTPLHLAAEEGHVGVVEKLISHYNSNRLELKSGKLTPMYLACQNGHLEVVKKIATMVPQWVNSSDSDNNMQTPLHVASEKGYEEIVNILMLHNAKPCPTKNGSTPIHMAVQKGHIKVMRTLLSKFPGEVNTADKKKQTPLHHAARECGDYPEIVTELIQRGANVDALDSKNYTPLMEAAAWENEELFIRMVNEDSAAVEKTLFRAARLPAPNTIRLILKTAPGRHLCSTCTDQDHNTALHIAASAGRTRVVELMFEWKCDIKCDGQNAEGKTPLHLATENGHHEIVLCLIKWDGAVVKTKDLSGFTPLHYACKKKDLTLVKAFELQLEDEDVIEANTHAGNTPLHIACMNGDHALDIVQLLIKTNARINATNKNGETAIHISAGKGFKKLTEELLKKGVDLDARDASQRTPLICAALNNHKTVVSLLLQKSSWRRSAVIAMDLAQSEDVVSKLFQISKDANIRKEVKPAILENNFFFIKIVGDQTGTKYLAEAIDPDNNTPLHLAAMYGFHEMVKILLGTKPKREGFLSQWLGDQDILVDVENIRNETPLHLAAGNGHLQTVTILINHQRQSEVSFKVGNQTPMHIACQRGHCEVVKEIASRVPEWIDAADSNRDMYTPLHYACKYSHEAVVSILLKHGASVSLTREEGWSPLHIAVMKQFTEGLKLLLEKKPQFVNCRDKQQCTPLHYAGKHCNKPEIVTLLLKRNGDLEAVDNQGLTPILTAVACENYESDAFNTMVELGGDSLRSTLFQAARKPIESNIQALKLISKACGFIVCYGSQDEDGNTPLHTSACCGNVEAVKVFLEWQESNPGRKEIKYVRNVDGKTPAHLAAEFNQSGTLEILIEQDKKVLMMNDANGRTVLHLAYHKGHLKVVELIESQLDPEQLQNMYRLHDNEGNTVLHLACQSQEKNVVLHLVDKKGAQIDARRSSEDKETPIHVAAQFQSTEIVDILLNRGADIESTDASGCTPLHYAAQRDQKAMIEHFHERWKANLIAENRNHITPLVMAAQNECSGAFQSLMRLMDKPNKAIFKMMELTVDHAQILRFMIRDSSWGGRICHARNDCQNTLLHVAALHGKTEAVKALMDENVLTAIKNDKHKSPLHLAAENGHASVVKEMISRKPSLAKEVDMKGMTPLHYACQQGHYEVVKAYESLLEEKEIRDVQNSHLDTPLHFSCRSMSVPIIRYLISKGADINAKNKETQTPLHIVIQRGHVNIAEILLKEKAEVNCQDIKGYTPLHYAAEGKSTDAVHLLCKWDADLSAEDSNLFTPVLTAAACQQKEVFECLMQYVDLGSITANPAFKVLAMPNYDSEILKFLLKYHQKLCHTTNNTGHTPLHAASECGNLEAVMILLDHGASADAQSHEHKTPMHLAAGKGLKNVVQHLIGYDPKLILCKDSGGRTPLHTACQQGQTEVVKVYIQNLKTLIEATDVSLLEVTDANGNTPLHLACAEGNKAVVQLLVDHGANITAVNSRGETPLHTAAQHKSVEIIKLLLDKDDTVIEVTDNRGSTPLHHAAENNQPKIITFLHTRGANIYAENQSLCTPVLTAAAHSKSEAFHCLMNLEDDPRNPIFKVLHVKEHRDEILKFLITDPEWGPKLVKYTDGDKNSVLHVTARENDLTAMAVLMEHKVESYIKNVDGKTPMHLTAERGHHDAFSLLMKYNSRLVASKDNLKMTPLHLACFRGHIKVVQLYKDHSHLKSVCECNDAKGNTPLHLACSGGNTSIVEMLIHSGADTKATNKLNEMPLHIAVYCGHVTIAQFLLKKQVPIECQTVEGHTPLHYAARVNSSEMISLLVDRTHIHCSANLYAKDNNLCTPTHIAAMHKHTDAYHYLMEWIPVDEHASVIFTALKVKCNRGVILKFLVQDEMYGHQLCQSIDETRNTPLHIASERGDLEAVKILLHHGASGGAQNRKIKTPMHLAAVTGMEQVVQQLIDHNPKLMLCKDIRGRTPLHTACQHGQMEVVRIHTLIRLLEANLLEVTDIERNTPMHLACVGGNKDIVQLLFDSDADLNQKNKKGDAPIHIAAQHGFIPVAEILLASGVDIECQSRTDKCTPLHHAAKYNQDKMIRFLHEKGANIHAEDCNLCTPVLVAAGCKHSTTHAFDCLMGFMELENAKQNPIIQVLNVKSNQEKLLKFLVNDKTWGQKLRDCTVENGNTALHVAAKQGNCLAVKVLLDQGFNARAKNMHDRSPMHLAAEDDQHMIVEALISYDASLVMDRDANGMIPLHLACLSGNIESVRAHHSQLTRFSKVREARDSHLNTSLHHACKGGSRKVAEYLFEVGCSMNAKNSDKDNLIHVAVQNGHVDITKLLLDKGTSTESVDAHRCTPLHIAAKRDQICTIQLLMKHHADLYAEDSNSLTPILAAAVHEKTEAFRCLMEYVDISNPKQNPIFKAIEIKSIQERDFNFLLCDAEWGLKLKQSGDLARNTPLHAAAGCGNLVAVKVLLDFNSDVYDKNCDGNLPIHLAAEQGHCKVMLELIHHNPQLSVAHDAQERTPLHIACLNGHRQVANVINLSLNEVLHASDLNGNTPLHLACEGRSEEIVQLLIDSGANLKQANNKGEIPTHIAVQYGSINIVKMLKQRCPDTLLCQDKYKRTVLHHAAIGKHNQEEMIGYLLDECGASIYYTEDHNLHTPILMSAAHSQTTAFRSLMVYADEQDAENPVFKTLCIKWKQLKILEFMISDSVWGIKLSETTDKSSGNSPLHVAARDGNQGAVSVFLKLKVRANIVNNNSKTPIHLAAESGQHVTVQQLIRYDSKLLGEPDGDGKNALHLACLRGHLNVVCALSDCLSEHVLEARDNEGNRPLHVACESNSADIVKLLVEMKADTTARNQSDDVPLLIAAREGNVEIGRLLVTGVDLASIKDSNGRNPLHNAVYHKKREMMQFLCQSDKKKTLLYDEDVNHCTPVLVAAACEYEDAFHCLMEYVDLNLDLLDPEKNPIFKAFDAQHKKMIILQFMIKDVKFGKILSHAANKDGRTPLHIAAEMGNIAITDLLISKYVQLENVQAGLVSTKDNKGMIPLHLACRNGETEIVEVHTTRLKDSFEQIREMQDNDGNTALHYACGSNSRAIVELLLNNGVRTTTKNKEMEAPIHIAAKSGFTVTAEMLLERGVSDLIEIKGDHKYTPLHYAAKNNHIGMIKMLCDRGADLYAEDERLYIPVMVASEYKRTEAFCCLMKYMKELEDGKKNPLFKVLSLEANDVLEFMLGIESWRERICDMSDDCGNTPLHIAAMQGNLNAVTLLVNHNAKTDAVNEDIKTPVHLAAEKGWHSIVQKLLELNPSLLNEVDNERKNPLHLACQHQHLTVVNCIFESHHYSRDILEACDKKGNTPLHLACMGGNTDIVQKLIEKGAKTNATNEEKRTPVHTAATYGSVDAVKLLVQEHKVPIKCWDYCKRTPLHLAAEYNQEKVVEFLHQCHLQQAVKTNIPRDADLHAEDDFSYTPVVLAAEAGSRAPDHQALAFESLMKLISNDIHDVNKNPLFQALKVGDKALPAVKFMIYHDVWSKLLHEVTDELKHTPLHVAAKNGLPIIVEEFLNHQVIKDMLRGKNSRDMTPLHLACQEGHHEVVKKLEHHLMPQDIRQEDREKNTALHLACEGGEKKTVQLLLEKGTSIDGLINVRNVRDEAPIHFAARYGYEAIVDLLLEQEVEIDVRDNHGCTPLHHAARNDQEKMIQFLCERNPELINLEDHDSHTPILTAAARSKVKAFQCLMSYQQHLKENPVFKALESKENPVAILKLMITDSKWGSKLRRATDSAGNTPLHIAAKHGNLAAIKVLLEGDSVSSEMYLVNNNGKTPMHMAAEGGYLHVVGELIHYQSNTKELQDGDKNTPLHLACMNGHLEVARMLLATHLLLKTNQQGNTPLHLACMKKGNIGIVKELLAAASDVNRLLNERNTRNQTPLDLAYQKKDPDVSIVLYLIGQGANVGLKPVFEDLSECHCDYNFFDWAIERKHRDIAMKIVEGEFWKEALRSCHFVVEDPLTEQGPPPAVNPQGPPPAVNPQGPPPAVNPQGPPPAINPQGPPPVVNPQGPPPAVNPQGPPPAVNLQDPPPAVNPQGPPPAVNLQDPPPAVNSEGQGEMTFQLDTVPTTDPPVFTLTTTSTGVPGPAVSWRRDGTLLSDDNTHSITSQVTNSGTATFTHTLTVTGRLVGEYQCNMFNSRTPLSSLTVVATGSLINFSAAQVGPDCIRVSWIPPATVSGYEVYWSGGGGADTGNMSVGAEDRTVTITDLTPGLTYDITLVALSDYLPSPAVAVRVTLGLLAETTPMRELIKGMPDVAEKVLDRCSEKEHIYEFLEDFKPMPWPCFQRSEHNDIERGSQNENEHWGPKRFDRSNHPLAIMVKHRRSDLLKHALVSTFLRKKFKFGAVFHLADLFLYLLFLMFLTSYALVVPKPLNDICATNASDHSSNVTRTMCRDWRQYSSPYILATFTIIFAIIELIWQFLKLCMLIIRYRIRLKDCRWHNNWKEFLSRLFFGTVRFLIFVFAIAFSSFQCPCVTNGQWQVGVLAVFLGWINMIKFIKLVPRLGVYVLMFQSVIYSFLKMLLLAIFLIIAFGLAFYMLFATPSQMRTPFATPARALIKTMTMPLANFDFDGMFHLSDDEDEIAYVGASYLMWIAFVFILAILFQNLLTSVAVGDIQEVRQNALLRQRELHVELLLNLEELFPQTLGDIDEHQKSHKTYRILKWIWELTSGASKVEQVHPLEHKLDQALSEIGSIKQILRDHSRKLEETESTVKQVEGHHEVHENLAQRTSEKLDTVKEQLEEFHSKFQQFSAAAKKTRRRSF